MSLLKAPFLFEKPERGYI